MTAPLSVPTLPYQPIVPRRRRDAYVALAKQRTGMSIAIYDYLTPVPWVVEAYIDYMRYNNAPYVLSSHQAELCALVVSHDHACRYCHGGTRAVLKISGMHEEQIRRLEQDLQGSDLPPADKRLLDVALKISRGRVSAEDVAALRKAGFDEAAVLELGFLVAGPCCFGFRLATPLGVSADDAITLLQRPWARVLWPAIALGIRWMYAFHRQGKVSAPEGDDAPFARIVAAYRPLPNAAHLLRTVIDAALASPVLSIKAKGLIFAVVARAMGDETFEAEATGLLVRHGVDRAEIERALRYLSCPTLSPLENQLLTFARDTVRYVPADLQDRARALKDGCSDEELIEALGIFGLANTLVRLSLLLKQV